MDLKEILGLFQLDLRHVEEVQRAFTLRKCPAKQTVFREGDLSDALYLPKLIVLQCGLHILLRSVSYV